MLNFDVVYDSDEAKYAEASDIGLVNSEPKDLLSEFGLKSFEKYWSPKCCFFDAQTIMFKFWTNWFIDWF